jgi:hypothetical protein
MQTSVRFGEKYCKKPKKAITYYNDSHLVFQRSGKKDPLFNNLHGSTK